MNAFFFSSRRRHTRLQGDWSSDVCSSDLIIEQLRKNQGGPVRLLDYLSQSMDPLKVWLTNVDGDKEIALTGKALTNDDIVEFIRNLQQSGYFAGVLLEESRQTAEEGLIIYSFRIKMAVKA